LACIDCTVIRHHPCLPFRAMVCTVEHVSQMATNATNGRDYSLVSTGAAQSTFEGARILFYTEECLCLNASQCQPKTSSFYIETHKVLISQEAVAASAVLWHGFDCLHLVHSCIATVWFLSSSRLRVKTSIVLPWSKLAG
jgi:hypothetical protein